MRPLYEAASKDDLALLGRCLQGEFGPIDDEVLNLALLRATTNGNTTCASVLLAHDADVNEEDFDGDTPLMLAAINGFQDLVELYINNGCDVHKTSHKGRTALHMAVWNNHPRIVDVLIQAGIELDVEDCFGETALMLCAIKGHEGIMKTLIAAGCDLDETSSEGENALHYAAKHGHVKCIEVLLSHRRQTEGVNMWGTTPLLQAAMLGQEDSCLTLLRHGAYPSPASRSSGKTALHFAGFKGMKNLTRALLRKGVDPDVLDFDNNTPLMAAIEKNHVDVILTLLQFGCSVTILGRGTFDHAYAWCFPVELACHLHNLKVAQMVYACGGHLEFLHCQQDCFTIQGGEGVKEWIKFVRSTPRSLIDWCRIAIRGSIKGCVGVKVKTLPLPKPLQHFLSCYDLALRAKDK